MSSRKALEELHAASKKFDQFEKPSARILLVKWCLLQRAVADPDLTQTDIRVFARLLDHFNGETGRCDPAVPTIAQTLSCCDEIVRKSTKGLERAGLIDIERRAGNGFTNQYNPRFERFDEYYTVVVPLAKAKRPQRACESTEDPEQAAQGPRNARSGKTGNESGKKKRSTKKTSKDVNAMNSRRRSWPEYVEEKWEQKLVNAIGSVEYGTIVLMNMSAKKRLAIYRKLEMNDLDLDEAARIARSAGGSFHSDGS